MSWRFHRLLPGIAAAFFLLPLFPLFNDTARAVPQFDARFGATVMPGHETHMQPSYGMACGDCHINPTGGGLRTQHGREVMLDFLPMVKKDHAEFEEMISWSRNVAIGGDFRFMYLHSQPESTASLQNAFFPMQSDLYIAVSPTDQLTLYLQDGRGGPREYFGLFQKLPYNAYFKFGRFIPPYGLRLDDHTSFIREKLQLGALDQDAGVEAGFVNGYFFGHGAAINGNPGSETDDNDKKGFSGTAGFRSPYLTMGGSYYVNHGLDDERTYAGGYAMAHLGPISWLGEWDLVRVSDLNLDTKATGGALYQEINFAPLDGIVLQLKYDRYDPDDTVSDNELQRVTAGLDLYPVPYTEVLVQYRKNLEDPEIRNDQWLVMMHLFF
ncbi:MAG: hypothetical protein HY349_05790 [Nitrospirae bacterium]|nr:hypothetical protein [Nitrospirota bacterium]